MTAQEYDIICAERHIPGDYIFLYSVYMNEGILNAAKKLGKQLNMRVVTLVSLGDSYRALLHGIGLGYYEAPEDFLSYLKHAKYVCTNSFHGTMFSIIYRKQFLYLGNSGTDHRIKTILEAAGLQNRACTYAQADKSLLIKPDLYTHEIEARLQAYREQGVQFLHEALY